MENISVQRRDMAVKAKKLRQLGKVPGTVFGSSMPESISIEMEVSAAEKLLRSKREGSRLTLELDGKKLPVQIKELSVDVLSGQILNLSFQALNAEVKVNSVIHLLVANDEKLPAPLEKLLMVIPYASLPANMIDTLTVDVEGMKEGQCLFVKDIPQLMAEDIELQVDPEELVLRVAEKRRAGAE